MADLPVTVITTCTSRKAAGSAIRAERLYTGEQQRRLMQGVDELRRSLPVETWIISAKAGLVSGDELLSPYDTSFARLNRHELRRHAVGCREVRRLEHAVDERADPLSDRHIGQQRRRREMPGALFIPPHRYGRRLGRLVDDALLIGLAPHPGLVRLGRDVAVRGSAPTAI